MAKKKNKKALSLYNHIMWKKAHPHPVPLATKKKPTTTTSLVY